MTLHQYFLITLAIAIFIALPIWGVIALWMYSHLTPQEKRKLGYRIVMFTSGVLTRQVPSFLLLSNASVKNKERVLSEQTKSWIVFIGSVLTSVLVSFISRYILDGIIHLVTKN